MNQNKETMVIIILAEKDKYDVVRIDAKSEFHIVAHAQDQDTALLLKEAYCNGYFDGSHNL